MCNYCCGGARTGKRGMDGLGLQCVCCLIDLPGGRAVVVLNAP